MAKPSKTKTRIVGVLALSVALAFAVEAKQRKKPEPLPPPPPPQKNFVQVKTSYYSAETLAARDRCITNAQATLFKKVETALAKQGAIITRRDLIWTRTDGLVIDDDQGHEHFNYTLEIDAAKQTGETARLKLDYAMATSVFGWEEKFRKEISWDELGNIVNPGNPVKVAKKSVKAEIYTLDKLSIVALDGTSGSYGGFQLPINIPRDMDDIACEELAVGQPVQISAEEVDPQPQPTATPSPISRKRHGDGRGSGRTKDKTEPVIDFSAKTRERIDACIANIQKELFSQLEKIVANKKITLGQPTSSCKEKQRALDETVSGAADYSCELKTDASGQSGATAQLKIDFPLTLSIKTSTTDGFPDEIWGDNRTYPNPITRTTEYIKMDLPFSTSLSLKNATTDRSVAYLTDPIDENTDPYVIIYPLRWGALSCKKMARTFQDSVSGKELTR